MFLLAGLGNPGGKYAANRHNIGFMAVDEIARRHNFQPFRNKFQGDLAEGTIAGVKTLLLKPATYMNESGRALKEAAGFYKIPLDQVLVVYDELDLAPGKVRLKKGGGSGGHNGIKSIDAHLGKDYRRLRLGIGHPGDKSLVAAYVLHDFAKADKIWLDPLLAAIAECADLLAKGEDANFANKLALKINSNEPPGAKGRSNRSQPLEKKAQSHIHQARKPRPKDLPKSGPMADMLKKLLGGKD